MFTLSSTSGSSIPASEAESLILISHGDLYGSLMLAALIVYDSSCAIFTHIQRHAPDRFLTVLTFDKEVEFIWNNLRSGTSWIFLLNRYVGIASAIAGILGYLFNVDNPTCQMFTRISAISSGLTLFLFDYILLQRVLALYCRSKAVTRILFTLLSMEFVFGLASVLYYDIGSNFSVELLSSNAAFCGVSFAKAYIPFNRITWALPVFTGLLLMILSLYKSMQYRKESCGTDGYSLIDLLVRDQAMYFLVVVISSAAEIASYALSSPVAIAISATIGASTITSVIGSRLIINLKVDGKARANGRTDTRTELATVEFAVPRSGASELRSEDIA